MVPKIDRVDEQLGARTDARSELAFRNETAGSRIDQWEACGRTSSSFARSQPDPAGEPPNRTESVLPHAFDESYCRLSGRRMAMNHIADARSHALRRCHSSLV